jgi:N-methylhydantoinase B
MSKCVGLQIEEAEAGYPVRIERFELRRDSGGAGRYRGGLGLRRDVRVRQPAVLSISSDTELIPPPGVHGGAAGLPGRKILNPGAPGERRLDGKAANVRLQAGDLVSFMTPGSGGFGHPAERDPEAVRRDVLDGKVSPEMARQAYGITVEPDDVGDTEPAPPPAGRERPSGTSPAASAGGGAEGARQPPH